MTPEAKERCKFRQKLAKKIAGNSKYRGTVPHGIIKQVAFNRTQQAVKQFNAALEAAKKHDANCVCQLCSSNATSYTGE